MADSNKALGNVARQANKKLRRERILGLAKSLIATNGLEAFTLSQLADEAGVSPPTIHNLFGKKNDIVEELVSEMIEAVNGAIVQAAPSDPIENTYFVTDRASGQFGENEDFWRAAFQAAEHLGLFDPHNPKGLQPRAWQLAQPRQEWYTDGHLLGNVATHLIWKRVHDAQRLARLDWVSGHIDLKQYRRQVVQGILMTYAADASPELQVRLSKALSDLDDE
jgi:AcrR family transcriptional regulator